MRAVGAPNRVGVVAAALGNCHGGAGHDVIYIDRGVGAEGVLFADLLAAAVGDVPAVGCPVELLDAAEGFGGQFEEFLGAENVDALFRGDDAVNQGGDVAARHLGDPVIPVAVHEVFRAVGLGLVECRIGVGRLHEGGVLNGARIDDLRLVRGNLELSHSGWDVAEFHLLTELVALDGSLPELASLNEENVASVLAPAGARDALCEARELDCARAVGIADPEVAVGTVFRDALIGDAVEDAAAVGGELRVAEATQCEQHFGGHYPVCYLHFLRADVPALFFIFHTAADCRQPEGQRKKFSGFHDIRL